jgi:hypothetical protein
MAHPTRNRLLVWAGILGAQVLAATAAAQAPPATRASRTAPAAVLASDFAGVSDHAGALLAAARRYRATFGDRSVEFLPALGREAPRAEPWHVRFTSLRRGDDVLLRAADAAPARSHDRSAVRYAWPGVVERYVARPDGLKQSFVFAAPPPGRGDLAVRLAIETALPRATAGGLAWRDASGNGVRLGEVVGIDAAGRRCMGRAEFTDDGVELSLPAAFVDAAAYPLELDPLIATAVEALAGADCDFPDVAHDAFTGSYCVAWTQYFGGGTTGIVASVFLAGSLGFGYAFAINQTGDEDSVRVGNIAGTGLYVLVWTNYTSAGATISGLALEPNQAIASSVFTIDGPGNVSWPVISGEATVYDDDCLVAWLDGTYGLLGCSVTIDANLQPSATPIVQIAGGNVTEPALSKQGGAPGLHVVTWVDRPPGSPGWVRAQVVDHDMNLLGPGAWIQNTPQDSGWPAIDGDGFRFLVAWEEQEAQNPSATDVRGRVITVGNGGITSLGNVVDLVAFPGDLDYAADVALLGDKFGLTYMGQVAGPAFDDDVFFKAVAPNGTPIGDELRLDLTPGTDYRYEHAPRIIGRRDGDPATGADDGVVVFADQSVSTADSNVGLQAVESMGAGGAIVDLGGGCGPGGLATSPGPYAFGNATFAFELYGAQPLAIPFLLIGLPTPHLQCGVCTAIQSVLSWFVPNVAGTATTTFPAPTEPSYLGFQIEFQFVTLNVNYVGCPLLPGVAASNIVRATLGY